MDEGIRRMFSLVEEALIRMNTVLSGHKEDFGIGVSEDLERQINACRNTLKRQNIENLDARKYDYDKGTVFVDLFSECEKTGDYIINVVEARLGAIRNGIRRGKVFSREELLSAVWPDDVIVTARTVDVNITRIRKKIGPYADCIVTRPGFGYSFLE